MEREDRCEMLALGWRVPADGRLHGQHPRVPQLTRRYEHCAAALEGGPHGADLVQHVRR